jgi:hypothetical protein
MECCGGRWIDFSLHVKPLQLEVIPDGMEIEQLLCAIDEGLHVVVILAEPTKKLEDKVAIRQLLTQGADLVCHALHLVVVVSDAKTALPERTKPFVKLKDASLTVVEELNLDSMPHLSSRLQGFTNYLLQLDGENAKHPCQHDHVVVVPVCSVIVLVGEDIIIEGIAT